MNGRCFPMLPRLLLSAGLLAFLASGARAVDIVVNPDSGRTPISPYIYGTNADLAGVQTPFRRQGGNRYTGYNWETNASNAGNDYLFQSDNYLLYSTGLTDAQGATPAIVVTHFHDQSLAAGGAYSLVTVPMAGYVAADMGGPVTAAQAAPSSRWVPVVNTKPIALSLTPDLTDGAVYTDEYLAFLQHKYGPAQGATGIRGYSLDNEPDLWSAGLMVNGQVVTAKDQNGTHPLIHPAHILCTELIDRSVDTAKTIKRIDPAAEVYGFVSYGFTGYLSLQNAPDWAAERTRGNYRWFIDYFLDRMRQASVSAGQRLVDVLDLHNYSEATGGGVRINDYTISKAGDWTNVACNQARMQAPRTFWDASYRETSWIAQYNATFLPFLPNVQTSIDTFYPGTKFALTEYDFGGGGHVSGGIAEADILGIFGRYGVYAAALWPAETPDRAYYGAGFQLYLNYDNAGGRYGSTNVSATTSDAATCSVYASIEGGSTGRLHVIVLNKSYDTATPVNFQIDGRTAYARARVFAFDGAGATITERTGVTAIANQRFSYSVPPLTAAHFVLEAAAAAPAVPARVAAYASGATEVTLTWQPPAAGAPVTGYTLERAADRAFVSGRTSVDLPSVTSHVDPTAAAGTTYYYRLSAVNENGASAPSDIVQVQTPASVGSGAATFANIATRAYCTTGNGVTIGGFVVGAGNSRRVLLRAVGPSLASQGLAPAELLADPSLEVHHGNAVIASNDDWGDNANAADITSVGALIGASALSSGDTRSAALLLTLGPGVYSFVVNGKNGSSGIVLLEVYDADQGAGTSRFVNIATRAGSGTGDSVAIGGFVVTGAGPKQILVRAVGPTLATQGLGSAEVLANPTIELYRAGTMIATNDDWGDNANSDSIRTTGARIGATPFAGGDTTSAALLLKVPPGVYSFIARGRNDSTGIVLVEVYDAD